MRDGVLPPAGATTSTPAGSSAVTMVALSAANSTVTSRKPSSSGVKEQEMEEALQDTTVQGVVPTVTCSAPG